MMGRMCETGSGGATMSCEAGDTWNARVAQAVGALQVRLVCKPLRLYNKERGGAIAGFEVMDEEKKVGEISNSLFVIGVAELHGQRTLRTGFGSLIAAPKSTRSYYFVEYITYIFTTKIIP